MRAQYRQQCESDAPLQAARGGQRGTCGDCVVRAGSGIARQAGYPITGVLTAMTTLRVTLWGALALALTADTRAIFGTVV
jgi:hypothetical protein